MCRADRATFSSSGTEESGTCFANNTLRTSPQKTRRTDAGTTVSFDVRTKKRLTAEPPPHAALTSRPTTVRETTEIQSGTSDTDGARTGEYDHAAEFRPKKREAAQSGDLPSGSYSVPTPKDIPASCSFFIPAKTVPRHGRSCRLPHFSGHRRGFFAARRTRRPGFVSAVRDLRNAVRRQATRCPRTSISNESPFLNTSTCPSSKS